MFAPILNRVVARAVKLPGLQQTRGTAIYTDLVASPPLHRISAGEKLVHAAFLFFGVMGYPLIAMFTVAGHKRAEFAEMEIPDNWAEWRAKNPKKQ